jgi:glycosyltransferase involved in cell wall biosynthesis
MYSDLISIVIPIYNVEKELPECLESVINQTYTNLEIILVDDGSPDNCGAICEDYAKKDSRIVVVHKKNGGLSDARNAGVEVANGTYIGFVDSDDYIDNHMYDILYDAIICKKADIAECYSVSFQDGETPEASLSEQVDEYSTADWLTESSLGEFLNCVAWNKLYKKELFNGVRFPVGRYHEDEATTYKLIYKANKIVRCKSGLYFYRQRVGSIMQSGLSEKKIVDRYLALKDKSEFFASKCENAISSFCYARLDIYMIGCFKWMKQNGRGKSWYDEIKWYYLLFRNTKTVPFKYCVYVRLFLLLPNIIGK